MAYPVENLRNTASREEIQQAIEATAAQMVAEGMPPEQAMAEASRLAGQRVQSGQKLVSRRVQGPLQGGPANPGGGLMGTPGYTNG